MLQRFAVIGLGRYGMKLAVSLAEAGAEVIAIDRSIELVEEIRDRVTIAVALDSTDELALKKQGIDKIDVAIVAIGDDFEANVLTTVLLKHLGIKRVISRAASPTQARIQTKVGADSVVNPEVETAERWAHKLLAPFIVDHIEIAAGYGLIQMPTPEKWQDKTLIELDLRNKYNINIVALKRKIVTASETGQGGYEEYVVDTPLPDSKLGASDIIVVAGMDKYLEKLPH